MDPVIVRSKWGAANFSRAIAMKMKYLHVFGDEGEMGSLMVATDDNVYGVRYSGEWGLLGVPHRTGIVEQEMLIYKLSHQRVTCISVGQEVGAAVTADGRIFHWGRDLRAAYEVQDDDDTDDAQTCGVHQPDGSDAHRFVTVACGAMFVAALTTEGQVMLWGMIDETVRVVYGLALPTSPIMAFSCGMFHFAMLSTGGDVLTCGAGRTGQLGRKWNPWPYFSPKPVTFEHRCTRVVQVACGFASTLFLMEDGSLLATGVSDDEFGHLGVQTGEVYDGVVRFPKRVIISERVERIAVANRKPGIYAAETDRGNIFTWGKEEYPRKIKNETKLISAFYGGAIPSHLGDVIQPRPSPSRTSSGNAVGRSSVPPNQSPASRPYIPPCLRQPSATRPDAATRQGQPSASRADAATRQRQQTAREANVMSHELAAIITDLSDLRNEIGDLITSVASLQPIRNN